MYFFYFYTNTTVWSVAERVWLAEISCISLQQRCLQVEVEESSEFGKKVQEFYREEQGKKLQFTAVGMKKQNFPTTKWSYH